MEAANRGAVEGGGQSVGCNIELPFEQRHQPLRRRSRSTSATSSCARRCSSSTAEAFVIFPGGFGTLDELFEALTLVQTGKIRNFPIVLFNTPYWTRAARLDPGDLAAAEGKIAPEDLDLLVVTDSVEEACELITACYNEQCWDVAAPPTSTWPMPPARFPLARSTQARSEQ